MNDLMTFLSSINAPSQMPDPGTPEFTQWLLQQPRVPQYGKGGGSGASGLGNALYGLTQSSGATAANAEGAGLLSSL